jgi:hypothetical protein
MSRTVYRISIALMAWFLCVSTASAASDRDESRDGEDRWVPSIALVFGFLTQQQEGNVSSACLTPSQLCSAPQPPADNRKYETGLEAGGNIELLAPAFPLPLRPRFFVSGEITSVSAQNRNVAQVGDPSGLRSPDAPQYPEEAILGQGAKTSTDLENRLYGARAGFSFPLEIADWQLSIKPAAGYIHQKINFGGAVYKAYRPTDIGPTREVQLVGSDSSEVNAVGPSLEVEIEATRIRSIAASVYINGGAYRVLTDRSISFSTTAKDSLGLFTYQGNWESKLDPWIYRAAVGLRVKWLGVPSGWLGQGEAD